MKKIFAAFALGFITLGAAQYYPGNDGYYSNSSNGYYSQDYSFPDDYYYEYPNDYYADDYYRNYYNDYTRSISSIDWNRFFYEYRLSPRQMNMIMDLNHRFDSYAMWSSYYRMNPDRWYYDRFAALQSIMGPQIFLVFQQRYYNGYNPVDYFRNYRRQHYSNTYYVTPRYRNVDVSRYRVVTPQPARGFRTEETPQRVFRNENSGSASSVFRNNGNASNSGGFRTQQNNTRPEVRQTEPSRSGGFRSATQAESRNVTGSAPATENRRGFRTK